MWRTGCQSRSFQKTHGKMAQKPGGNNRKKGRTMFVMVRQLQSTPQGIPLELYFFTNKTGWADYEEIQSEIFDYVYAIIGKFGLKIYQAPSGLDLCRLDPGGNLKTF